MDWQCSRDDVPYRNHEANLQPMLAFKHLAAGVEAGVENCLVRWLKQELRSHLAWQKYGAEGCALIREPGCTTDLSQEFDVYDQLLLLNGLVNRWGKLLELYSGQSSALPVDLTREECSV